MTSLVITHCLLPRQFVNLSQRQMADRVHQHIVKHNDPLFNQLDLLANLAAKPLQQLKRGVNSPNTGPPTTPK